MVHYTQGEAFQSGLEIHHLHSMAYEHNSVSLEMWNDIESSSALSAYVVAGVVSSAAAAAAAAAVVVVVCYKVWEQLVVFHCLQTDCCCPRHEPPAADR